MSSFFPTLEAVIHAGGSDVLRVGLIGCGGRGTGAAEQALCADKNVKLVAMGDAFEDRLQSSLKFLLGEEKAAIKAGKPVFCEKPVAVDAAGVRSVLATCAEAKKKNLNVVSGLCLRYDYG